VKVDKVFKTDNIKLEFLADLAEWELVIGKTRVNISKDRFEELKAIMMEVLHGGSNE
jgi:hypothetical protein